ncbi:tRNA threonylcarbamoyladenosine biosynthesis protein TsaB [Persephonella hydrogeniphila]|uniref:tRNA threonylcarbamoyladenosine biosynthesis protein TsaB n=1 Tax=Persephonella hydrogeniphila TaxID=198703 RepID=A0A285NIZ4_9AQUI|nr:tRNA (adenosine(37)-N6)-threonylcarbamoyltransferase complex dimerization subunit type 1 TsaB [Persephonella hydrogeniphila]SNZ09460.1 tRNA threonylcarbamoyladenosine biosynthesis protein TsaB [Persephonella hydrogeniphila]
MILSIDTFSENLGISLIDGHKLVAKNVYHKVKPFSELLLEKIDSMFNQFGYDPSVLYAVCVNKGPGSYTGLRVGVTVAKTLSYSLNIPIYSFSSLEAMAFKYRHCKKRVVTAINAGKGECYISEFETGISEIKPISDIKLVKISQFKENTYNKETLIIVKNIDISGDNVISLVDELSTEGAFYALKENKREDLFRLEPVYIRPL